MSKPPPFNRKPPAIGHNGGPPLNGPGWGSFVWRMAAKKAWKTPGPEVARLRLRRAAAIGLDYRRYQSISMHAGRPPTMVFFDLGGTLVRIVDGEVWTGSDGTVALLPGVGEKLHGLTVPSVYVVSNQAAVGEGRLSEDEANGFIQQVNAATANRIDDHRICTAPADTDHPWRKPRPGMVMDLLQTHRQPPTAAIMIGDGENDEACAANAGLAGFIWADEYFAKG
jgi:D-glycero-D-manno-heptose 1,7-bisphosphate phosphatase